MNYSDIPTPDRVRESSPYGLILTQPKGLPTREQLEDFAPNKDIRRQVANTGVLEN